jgi:hypothetical protein
MIKSNKVSNPFIIAAQALVPVPHSAILAPRHKIKIKDFPDVQVGNWMDWQPREAIKGEREELQSNLTLEEAEKLTSEVPIGDDDKTVDLEETIEVDVE